MSHRRHPHPDSGTQMQRGSVLSTRSDPFVGGDAAGEAQRGSVLLMLPACVLIVLIMASIAVDLSLVQLRQRQASTVAASAADDAVTAGADVVELRTGSYVLDQRSVTEVVERTVAQSDLSAHLDSPPEIEVESEVVRVTLAVRADYLFAGVVPGAPDGTVVMATASATAHEL